KLSSRVGCFLGRAKLVGKIIANVALAEVAGVYYNCFNPGKRRRFERQIRRVCKSAFYADI
ncbi:PIPO, partial [Lily virus A]